MAKTKEDKIVISFGKRKLQLALGTISVPIEWIKQNDFESGKTVVEELLTDEGDLILRPVPMAEARVKGGKW
jgi:hypothetical protein